jgi:hypothetical protein
MNDLGHTIICRGDSFKGKSNKSVPAVDESNSFYSRNIKKVLRHGLSGHK